MILTIGQIQLTELCMCLQKDEMEHRYQDFMLISNNLYMRLVQYSIVVSVACHGKSKLHTLVCLLCYLHEPWPSVHIPQYVIHKVVLPIYHVSQAIHS